MTKSAEPAGSPECVAEPCRTVTRPPGWASAPSCSFAAATKPASISTHVTSEEGSAAANLAVDQPGPQPNSTTRAPSARPYHFMKRSSLSNERRICARSRAISARRSPRTSVALYDDVSLSSALSSTDGAAGLRGAAGVGGIGMSIMPTPATKTRGTGTSDLGFGGTAGICGWSEGQPIMPHGCCGPGGCGCAQPNGCCCAPYGLNAIGLPNGAPPPPRWPKNFKYSSTAAFCCGEPAASGMGQSSAVERVESAASIVCACAAK